MATFDAAVAEARAALVVKLRADEVRRRELAERHAGGVVSGSARAVEPRGFYEDDERGPRGVTGPPA